MNYISKDESRFMRPSDPVRTQQLYFLKKLHKTPHSERPIVSGCSSPSENISKYIDYLLQSLMATIPTYLKNMYQLTEDLQEIKIPKNSYLCTVDVISLYPSIPKDEGTKAC